MRRPPRSPLSPPTPLSGFVFVCVCVCVCVHVCVRMCVCVSRSEEHTSELQSHLNLVCRLLLEKKKHIERLCARAKRMCHDVSYATSGALCYSDGGAMCCVSPDPPPVPLARARLFFFFKNPAPPETYTLSLHDALPI